MVPCESVAMLRTALDSTIPGQTKRALDNVTGVLEVPPRHRPLR